MCILALGDHTCDETHFQVATSERFVNMVKMHFFENFGAFLSFPQTYQGWIWAQTGPHGTPSGPLSCLHQHLTGVGTILTRLMEV